MHYFLKNYRLSAKMHHFSIRLHVLGRTTQALLPNFTFMALYCRRLRHLSNATKVNLNILQLHCRHCGRIYCTSCLVRTVNSGPNNRPSKVCDVCHTLLVRDSAPYFSTVPPQADQCRVLLFSPIATILMSKRCMRWTITAMPNKSGMAFISRCVSENLFNIDAAILVCDALDVR